MSRNAKLAAFAVAVSVATALPFAEARQPTAAAGEIVITAEGKLATPWVEKQACVKGTTTCKTMIVNSATNEIARMGDQLSSRFEPTGNGQEVRRALSARDRANQQAADQ